MTFAVGSLVHARGREWVVLPESQGQEDLLILRPLVGSDDETTGIYLPLETVTPARFALPDPDSELGNHRSCALLGDAVRLGLRSAAGPFRSLGAIAVEPRPYQLVPLLMALRLDPVRLLLADDVGVGKSIEAGLILRELLDRGEIRTSAILCPPHLAEQWHRMLTDFFHLNAALVLRSTAARLEREAGIGDRSVFEFFHHVVVSMDYIKMETRRHELLRAGPDLVIVDEAHGCAAAAGVGRAAQQRHALLRDLAADPGRHLVLVTATPHSGKEEAFRSLLELLDPDLAELPDDLTGEANRRHREHLAQHFVQRRRGDLADYLGAPTPFPQRESAEEHYTLTEPYRRFFDRVLAYCREQVQAPETDERRRRVRWWSALALLRALGSSPAAAARSLRNRAQGLGTETVEEADEIGRRAVLDLDHEAAEGHDVVFGSRVEGDDEDEAAEPEPDERTAAGRERARLNRLAREVEKLAGQEDAKLRQAVAIVRRLLEDGYAPILFCRFIPTVEYLAAELRQRLGAEAAVEAVTGLLPAEERERRVEAIGNRDRRVLVSTDCLSEGINLQEHFDAVVHYDLSWNPTRHEQREGRVDRYGQERETVRTLTFYGDNNPIDGTVLEVLLRKHEEIRRRLGISVPVPLETDSVQEAIFEGLLLREDAGLPERQLGFAFPEPHQEALEVEWRQAAEREKRSRTIFAQHQIRVDEVERELRSIRGALGDAQAVAGFMEEALATLGAVVVKGRRGVEIDLAEAPRELRDALGDGEGAGKKRLRAVFEPPGRAGVEILTRTHPLVAATANRIWSEALDPEAAGTARRCGVVRTDAVEKRTTLLLLRVRFHILIRDRGGEERPLLAEDLLTAAFRGSPERAEWLPPEEVEPLLGARPAGNVAPDLARNQLRRILDRFEDVRPRLDELAAERGEKLLAAHRRVRQATRETVRSLRVEHLPSTDVLGLFVYLPQPKGGAP